MLILFTTMSSELLDDNVVTHIMCIANFNLLDDSAVTYDERFTDKGFDRHFPVIKISSTNISPSDDEFLQCIPSPPQTIALSH